ncbi:MAG: SDR family oxidoreductase [Candidatus Omnitrophota bacterium]|jgi:dTDP-glucose 4,6-dehydratase|nr:MAG: SDR family oxidoreductase [Candidatus Omnitrophota bacterium]
MRLLITGGSGFIGSHLCRTLLAQGNTVICVDNFITGDRDNIKDLIDNPSFVLIEHDISEPLKISEKLDWILHFASPASPKDYLKHPIKTLKVGTLGTHNCLGISRLHNARFFLASTSEVYGDPAISPQPEEYWGNVNPVGVRSCYDEAKRAAEALTSAYRREHNIDTKIVRIFNTYGPSMRLDDGRVVSNFIYQALTGKNLTIYGKGDQTRSFCYIDDLVEGILKFLEVDYPGPLNLGTEFEFTILELAKQVIEVTGSTSRATFLPLPEDDPKQRRPDLSKAKKLLTWNPRIGIKEGLERTIPYFRKKLGSS